MTTRLPIILLAALSALLLPAAASAAETPAQRLFRDKLLKEPAVSDEVKAALRGRGFVDRAVVFQDLTGEGRDDAVVAVHSGGSAGRIALFVYSSLGGDGDDLALVYRNQRLYRARFATRPVSAERPRGAFLYRLPVYDPGDELCCPGAHRETELRWSRTRQRFLVVRVSVTEHVREAYAAPTGDYSTSARREGKRIIMEIRTTSFSGDYFLCVAPPDAANTCRTFRLERTSRGDFLISRVNWASNYPNGGRGRYRVTWRLGGRQLGPALTFRRR